MAIVFIPESCPWSPDPIVGPNTERTDYAVDTNEPDLGASRGRLERITRTTNQGQTADQLVHAVRGVELPEQANEAASLAIALAQWRNPSRPGLAGSQANVLSPPEPSSPSGLNRG